MQILDVKAHYSEKIKKQIFEIKVKIPSLQIKNSLHFGIFLCEMLDGKNLKTPSFDRSSHDYKIDKSFMGKECTFIVTFDKNSEQNRIGNVLRFCFGLRDFGVRWFPETFIWVDNDFKYIPDKNVPEEETANEVIQLTVDDILLVKNEEVSNPEEEVMEQKVDEVDSSALSDENSAQDIEIVKSEEENNKSEHIEVKKEYTSNQAQKTSYKGRKGKQR